MRRCWFFYHIPDFFSVPVPMALRQRPNGRTPWPVAEKRSFTARTSRSTAERQMRARSGRDKFNPAARGGRNCRPQAISRPAETKGPEAPPKRIPPGPRKCRNWPGKRIAAIDRPAVGPASPPAELVTVRFSGAPPRQSAVARRGILSARPASPASAFPSRPRGPALDAVSALQTTARRKNVPP